MYPHWPRPITWLWVIKVVDLVDVFGFANNVRFETSTRFRL